jgi:hypothetical protein
MMRTKGVELYNEDVEKYKKRQDVIDDILVQMDSEKRKYKNRAKNYEKLEHDMILWHVARDRRAVRIDSPLDAVFWVVTIDYRMLGFDKYKKRMFRKAGQENTIPVCVYPTTLIQMLQFWIPRTPEFEEAMLSSMRLPFLYPEFDPGAEKVTLDILRTLGQYEGISEIRTETVSSMLVNTALRDKMSATKGIEKKAELIKDALFEQHKRATDELRAVAEELRLKDAALAVESRSKQAAEQELADKASDLLRLQNLVEKLTAASAAEKEVLSSRITQLEESAVEKDRQTQIRQGRIVFALKWTGLLILGTALMSTSGVLVSRTSSLKAWQMSLLLTCVGGILWAVVVGWYGSRSPDVKTWRIFLGFKRLRKWIFGALAALILGVLANFIHDWMKSPSPNEPSGTTRS